MAEITLTVDVDASVEETWRAATDFPAQGAWMLGTKVRPTSRSGSGVGDRYEAVTGFGRLGIRDPFEITVWEPPHRCLVLHSGKVVMGSGAFEVQPLPGGRSRFVWTEWLVLPLGLFGQLGYLLVRPLVVAGFQFSLNRFARWAERQARATSAA